ncbi:DUF4767 domain-containing protein [Weissella thailandensis]|uniref:DUF4767 domain-containing protein n=1 Tax=Weissella thailandensis TaxID=89061 RepID=UPI0027E58628|nr:DUF4767 domain-containing protein [Weissella thailandensis]
MESTDFEKLNKLKKMLDEGIITSSEFNEMKQVIIADSKSLQQSTEARSRRKRGWIIPVVVVVVILIGGGGGYIGATYISQRHSGQEVVQSSRQSSLKKETSATKHETIDNSKTSSDQSQSSSVSEVNVSTGWTAAKQADLSTFMAQWQEKMNQRYEGTYDGQIVDHLGFKLPEQIQNGEMRGKIELNEAIANVVWDPNGNKQGDYQVVAAASGTIPGQMYPTTYLFMLDHGQPVVYMTQTSNGDVLSFTPTANTELQSGFKNIVNG